MDHGSTSKFAAKNDQGVIEYSALFEIFDESGAGLINVFTVLLETTNETSVLVPRFVEELDEANATLDETPGEEGVVGE